MAPKDLELIMVFNYTRFDVAERGDSALQIVWQMTIELGSGCYLTISESSGGSIFSQWSEAPIKDALAYFKPNKVVPKWKFNSNGGKTEVVRNANKGVGVKEFYRGFCMFVKMAKSFDADFVVLENSCGVYLNFASTPVIKASTNSFVSTKGCVGVGVTHADNKDLAEVLIDNVGFIGRANSAGCGIALN